MDFLEQTFRERVISRKTEFFWPLYSPDLNPCDLYLSGEVYKDPAPETIQDLKRNIKREIRKINLEVLLKVCDNFVSRLQNVNAKRGVWIEHIIEHKTL